MRSAVTRILGVQPRVKSGLVYRKWARARLLRLFHSSDADRSAPQR
jgi:hypothetical protein